jgi:FkbM family methyltransferase
VNLAPIVLPESSLWSVAETMRDMDPMLAWIARHLSPIGSMLDIGAHVGAVSMLARYHFGPALRVEAYEPHPTLAKMCADNFEAAGVNGAVHEQAVCGAFSGRVDLAVRGDSLLGCSVAMRDRVVEKLSVRAVGSDELREVDVVKIDAEGSEADIVRHFRHWPRARALLVETHSRDAAHAVRQELAWHAFELVRALEHVRFPYRLELWAR